MQIDTPVGQRGYSLIELTIVVAILAMVAAIAMPSVSAGQHRKLALATSVIADAVRFAREEARRTETLYGVDVDTLANRVRVFRLDETPNPNQQLFDVYHPVWKQLYTVDLTAPPYRGVNLASIGGQILGTCTVSTSVVFDSAGVTRCFEPATTRIEDADITIALGDLDSHVLIDSFIGRVITP